MKCEQENSTGCTEERDLILLIVLFSFVTLIVCYSSFVCALLCSDLRVSDRMLLFFLLFLWSCIPLLTLLSSYVTLLSYVRYCILISVSLIVCYSSFFCFSDRIFLFLRCSHRMLLFFLMCVTVFWSSCLWSYVTLLSFNFLIVCYSPYVALVLCYHALVLRYEVTTMSRLLKIIGLFCKRALQKRLCSAKRDI